MGRKKQDNTLGRTVIKNRFGGGRKTNKESHMSKLSMAWDRTRPREKNDSKFDYSLHTSELNDGYDWGRLNLQSVTEQSNLDEFLATAELAGTEFTAEKLNVTVVNTEKHTGLLTAEEEELVKNVQEENRMLLSIPRRPEWDETTTPEELDQLERESFLEWRRKLAELQEKEHLILTPFERNLDFWRQLWRVIERSDVIVQIVDARNPLLFYCDDLSKYVSSKGKVNALLINKADLLSEKQRNIWTKYMENKGINVAFWSAFEETERIKVSNVAVEKERADPDKDTDEMSDDVSTEDEEKTDKGISCVSSTDQTYSDAIDNSGNMKHLECNMQTASLEDQNSKKCNCPEKCDLCESRNSSVAKNGSLLNGEELIDFLRSLRTESQVTEGVTTVGLVGYPNVGKSSTINAILQTKKVPVSATPGRTKHFQTLYVDKETLLCDCPGLVMPTFVSTKADMVVSGILPIDQMRDFVPPISLICRHIPRIVLEATYGILLPKPEEGEDPNRLPTAHELLGTYGLMRGFMTHKGVPDFPRSARCILKDYVNGKLLYCHPPPEVTAEEFHPCPDPVIKERKHKNTSATKKTKTAEEKPIFTNQVDRQFFEKNEPKIGSKGRHGVLLYTRKDGFTQHHSAGGSSETSNVHSSQMSVAGKPWKRHNNRGKKQKLRRIHRDLDIHDF